jgi:hypothetical protein
MSPDSFVANLPPYQGMKRHFMFAKKKSILSSFNRAKKALP